MTQQSLVVAALLANYEHTSSYVSPPCIVTHIISASSPYLVPLLVIEYHHLIAQTNLGSVDDTFYQIDCIEAQAL